MGVLSHDLVDSLRYVPLFPAVVFWAYLDVQTSHVSNKVSHLLQVLSDHKREDVRAQEGLVPAGV